MIWWCILYQIITVCLKLSQNCAPASKNSIKHKQTQTLSWVDAASKECTGVLISSLNLSEFWDKSNALIDSYLQEISQYCVSLVGHHKSFTHVPTPRWALVNCIVQWLKWGNVRVFYCEMEQSSFLLQPVYSFCFQSVPGISISKCSAIRWSDPFIDPLSTNHICIYNICIYFSHRPDWKP